MLNRAALTVTTAALWGGRKRDMSIETPRAAHLPGIQALRGLAALLVVITHIYSMELKYSPDQLLGQWSYYGGTGVDLFFVISGFIMVHVTRDAARGPAGAGHFLLRRAARIYPLYWLVSAALLAVYLYRPDIVFSGIDRAPDLIKSFTLWPDYRPPLLAIGWTLTFEIMFYLFFAVALLLPKKRIGLFLTIWTAGILIAHIPDIRTHLAARPLPALLTSAMSLEFIAGAALALWLPKLTVTRGQSVILIALGFLTGLIGVAVLSYYGEWILDNFPLRAAIFGGPAAMIVFGLAAGDFSGRPVSKVLQKLGDWSYAIYLTHILTLAIIGLAWRQFATQSLIDNVLMVPALLAASILVGGLVYKFIERPVMNAVKKGLPAAPQSAQAATAP